MLCLLGFAAFYTVDFSWNSYFVFCTAFGEKNANEVTNTAKNQTVDAGEFI